MKRYRETKILWHYTSIENAINILTTRELWATHNSFLNDSSEIKIPIRHFLKYVKTKKYEGYFEQDFLDDLRKTVEENCLDAFYVLSFSSKKDDLNLWSNYTPNGGCAIGFDKLKLFNWINHTLDNSRNFHPFLNGLFKVNYTTMQGKNSFKKLDQNIDTIIRRIKNIQNDGAQIGIQTLYEILQICAATKDNSYSNEKEYRFVLIADYDKSNDNVIYFNHGRPIIKVKLPPITDCVTEIHLSPHEIQNLTKQTLNFALQYVSKKENKEANCSIKQSKLISYRKPKI